MPQPAISLQKYLTTALPPVKENFPMGGGATGARNEFTGTLKGVSIIDDFESKVESFVESLPSKALSANPAHPFPHFLTVLPQLPKEVKSAQDVQQYIRQLPLAATSASLSALAASENGITFAPVGGATDSQNLDAAGYESDGGEAPAEVETGKTAAPPKEASASAHEDHDAHDHTHGAVTDGKGSYGFKFSKSPMGSGEFLLSEDANPEKILAVVRTINISAFSAQDWKEFLAEGPYTYNKFSKASWYHSRIYGATKRLGCKYFAFTDYQRWIFGAFTEGQEHVQISPILNFSSKSPSILSALLYWTRSAIGQDSKGFKAEAKDVSGKKAPYSEEAGQNGAPKRKDLKRVQTGGVSVSAESDIEE